MKKLAAILFCLMLLCSCSTDVFTGNASGISYVKDKPSAGNYFTYTPVIDIFSPELDENAVFLDFDGRNFYIDSASDKAFLFAFDIESRKKVNLTNIIGFQSGCFLCDGEVCYYIKNDEKGIPFLMIRNLSSGAETSVILQKEEYEYEENFVSSAADYSLFRSRGYVIVTKTYENGGISAVFYNFENGVTEYIKNSVLFAHKSIPTNGWFTYAEKSQGGFQLYAITPEKGKSAVRGPVTDEEILFSAYDGKTFVWATSEGIFCRGKKETVHITDEAQEFAFLGRNFVIWASEGKIGLYRLDRDYRGAFDQFESAELIFADENAAVFKNSDPDLGEEYISIQMKVGEEPEYMKEVNDTAPYTIAVDGYLYYCYLEPSGITPTEKQIAGKITSAWNDASTVPRRNDQSNDLWFIGRQYAFADGVLLLENESGTAWYLCKKSYALSEMNFG